MSNCDQFISYYTYLLGNPCLFKNYYLIGCKTIDWNKSGCFEMIKKYLCKIQFSSDQCTFVFPLFFSFSFFKMRYVKNGQKFENEDSEALYKEFHFLAQRVLQGITITWHLS